MSMNLAELVAAAGKEGYLGLYAEAKVAQDIVLKAIEKGNLGRNVTVKGGIVMRSITGEKRRATRDMDFDFIRYSLDDDSIRRFVEKLNSLDGIRISMEGEAEELSQDEYEGKRIHIAIKDAHGHTLKSKIDLGVHSDLSIVQEEYCFDVCFDEEGASLMMNSKEQIFAEKLRSLLRFGPFSTRYKDVFDMYYLSTSDLDIPNLLKCFDHYIFSDSRMREKNLDDVVKRIEGTFSNARYMERLKKSSRADWLKMGAEKAAGELVSFFSHLQAKTSHLS